MRRSGAGVGPTMVTPVAPDRCSHLGSPYTVPSVVPQAERGGQVNTVTAASGSPFRSTSCSRSRRELLPCPSQALSLRKGDGKNESESGSPVAELPFDSQAIPLPCHLTPLALHWGRQHVWEDAMRFGRSFPPIAGT